MHTMADSAIQCSGMNKENPDSSVHQFPPIDYE
jgi:hypothetical protein